MMEKETAFPLTKQQLEEVFIDVRKAFRLLYQYQRRVLDTVQFIADRLSKDVASGYSLFSELPPRNGSRLALGRWAWDWLPMMCYEFYFGKENIRDDEYQFAIAVYSDTGYDDSDGEFDQNEVDRFRPVEQSTTKLFFYLGRNLWKPNEFDFEWGCNSGDELVFGDETKKFISKRFDLSDFRDEFSITAKLDEFKNYCVENGLKAYFRD